MLCCRKTKGVCQDKSTKCVPQEPGVAKQQVRVQRLDPTTRLRHCSLGKPTLGSCCASRLVARDADEPVILDASMYQGATVAVSHQHCLRVPVNTAGCATERRPGCGHGAQTKGCQTQWSAWRGGGGGAWRWACGTCRASNRRSPGALTLERLLHRVFVDVAGRSPPPAYMFQQTQEQ